MPTPDELEPAGLEAATPQAPPLSEASPEAARRRVIIHTSKIMKYKIFSLTIIVALLLITSNTWTQAGSLTSTEQQRVGKVVGTTTSGDKVGVARAVNHHVVEKLAIGVGEVPANGDDDSGEGKASWSFLSLSEAKQASKALAKMQILVQRKANNDIAHKGLAFTSSSGFSIDYQETLSGRLLTISAGENGGRRCDFTDMEYIRLVKGCKIMALIG